MRRSLAVLAVFALAGCKSSGFSALQSVNPVMLGPVRSLGSAPPPAGPTVGPFESKSEDYASEFTDVEKSGRTTTTTTTTESVSASPNQVDLDVLLATHADPSQRVVTDHIQCGGFDFFFVADYIADSWCEGTGRVDGAPAGAEPLKKAPADAAQGTASAQPQPAAPQPATGASAP